MPRIDRLGFHPSTEMYYQLVNERGRDTRRNVTSSGRAASLPDTLRLMSAEPDMLSINSPTGAGCRAPPLAAREPWHAALRAPFFAE